MSPGGALGSTHGQVGGSLPAARLSPRFPLSLPGQHTHSLPSSSMSSTSYLRVNKRTVDAGRCTAQVGDQGGGLEVAQVACSLHAVPVPRGLGVHSLVGGMAVTDHLSQDPLLVPIHGLHPGSHFISRFGHIVPRGWNGPAEWGGPEGGVKC